MLESTVTVIISLSIGLLLSKPNFCALLSDGQRDDRALPHVHQTARRDLQRTDINRKAHEAQRVEGSWQVAAHLRKNHVELPQGANHLIVGPIRRQTEQRQLQQTPNLAPF